MNDPKKVLAEQQMTGVGKGGVGEKLLFPVEMEIATAIFFKTNQ